MQDRAPLESDPSGIVPTVRRGRPSATQGSHGRPQFQRAVNRRRAAPCQGQCEDWHNDPDKTRSNFCDCHSLPPAVDRRIRRTFNLTVAKRKTQPESSTMAFTVPWQLMGIWVSGDIGGLTIYTDKHGRKVAFPKAPPKEPPSPAQVHQRQRFQAAQAAWKSLSSEDKQQLETATIRGSIVMTGQNLFISVSLRNDNDALITLARQTNTQLPTVPFIS